MAQLRAQDALEPFVALSMSANSPRQVADLVVRATSHPSTYFFAELLQSPHVQALATADAEYAAYLTVLQIFSYGTYADYERGTAPLSTSPHAPQQSQTTQPQTTAAEAASQSASPLPPLSEAQATKLRQLSLISLATDRASLGYDHLVRALRLADARQLETLVMAAVYAGLVTGTLDPAHQVVRISSVAPLRDPAPGALPKLHTALRDWSQRCETTLAELDAQIAGIRRAAAVRAEEEQKWDAQFKRAVESEKRVLLNKDGSISGDNNSNNNNNNDTGGGSTWSNVKRAMTLNVTGAAGGGGGLVQHRFNKRGSNLMADAGGPSGMSLAGGASGSGSSGGAAFAGVNNDDDDDEAMDLDDDEGGEGNKRNRLNA